MGGGPESNLIRLDDTFKPETEGERETRCYVTLLVEPFLSSDEVDSKGRKDASEMSHPVGAPNCAGENTLCILATIIVSKVFKGRR